MTGTTLEDRIVVPVGRAMSDRGTARWLRRYRLVGWLEIAIGIAGFIAAVAGIAVQANSAAALLRTGARTPGVVTYYSPGDGRYNEGYFEVTYTANGVTRSGVINLTSTSASYHAGERVTVVYNRHDPGQIRTPQEQNEPSSTVSPLIIGLVSGPILVIVGWIVLIRAGRWSAALAGAPWVAYRAKYVRPRTNSPGFVLISLDASPGDAFPMRLHSMSRWRLGRLERSAPSTVWLAGDPRFDVVIGLPSTRELYGASPPRGRVGERFVEALRTTGQLPTGVSPPR